MTKIKIAYRQTIDSKSTSGFERKVFTESFNEFCLQSQAYNEGGRLKTLKEQAENNPKANSLHYKVGFSVGRYISDLNQLIPDLQDSIGRPVPFENHEFQLLSSDITSKDGHKIAIIYTSAWLDLLAVAGAYLILGMAATENAPVSTLTISLRENLSVVEWSQQDGQRLNIAV